MSDRRTTNDNTLINYAISSHYTDIKMNHQVPMHIVGKVKNIYMYVEDCPLGKDS